MEVEDDELSEVLLLDPVSVFALLLCTSVAEAVSAAVAASPVVAASAAVVSVC